MESKESKNTMTFDLTSSKQLADMFAVLNPGDEFNLEIRAIVTEKGPNQAKAAMSRLEYETQGEEKSVDGSEMASSIAIEGSDEKMG